MSVLAWSLAIALVTLVPAPDVREDVRVVWSASPLEFAANVALFMPVCFAVGLRSTRAAVVLTAAAAGTITIELVQLAIPGRETSVFDLAANLLGAILGLGIARWWKQVERAEQGRVGLAALMAGTVLMAIGDVVGSRFIATAPPYYVQIAPRLTWLPHTTWEVSDVRVADVTVADGVLRGPATRAAAAPCAGGQLQARLIAREQPSAGWSPLVRVSDEAGESLTILAEWNGALLLSRRTAAGVLGAGVAWHALVPRVQPGDTLHLHVSCTPTEISWRVTSATHEVAGRSDLRFGLLVRSLSSALIVPFGARWLLAPLTLLWFAMGLLGALGLSRLGGSETTPRWVAWTTVALAPGAVAWSLAVADTRVAAAAWTASFIVSFLVLRATASQASAS